MNIEPLEARIAPAVIIVNATTATYNDVDGDKVTIKTTAGTLNNSVFTSQGTAAAEQLLLINLTGGGFTGTDLTVTVVKVAGGDGIANIGAINATGVDLGKVKLPGDLGQIDAGDATTTTTALELLKVRSLGLFGLSTQQAGGSLESDINGSLGALEVAGDVQGAYVAAIANNKDDGKIGSIFIGGSLIASGTVNFFSGEIITSGDMGPVTIKGDLIGGAPGTGEIQAAFGRLASVDIGGSVIGGWGDGSTRIFGLSVGSVKIGGDLIGGAGESTARIISNGNLDSVEIGGSVLGVGASSANIRSNGVLGPVTITGNLVGGADASAQLFGEGITSVTIGGSMVGGAGQDSAVIFTELELGPVKIGRDLKGGTGNFSGRITTLGGLASLEIDGSLLGSSGSQDLANIGGFDPDGQVFAGTGIGPVVIGGDVAGGSGFFSGAIQAGHGNDGTIHIDSVTIKGSLIGGIGSESGSILSAGHIGAVSIDHSVLGGSTFDTGVVSANGGDLGAVTIGGSLVGGSGGTFSGGLFSRQNMGLVNIGSDLLGGAGERSGYISSFGTLAGVTIGGSLVGGNGPSSGAISSKGALGPVSITHDLLGGSLGAFGNDLSGSGSIVSEARIASIFIGGSIISGTDGAPGGTLFQNASIRAGQDIGSLTVIGDIVGNVAQPGDSPVIISAVGQATPGAATDLAIGEITIVGRVEWTRILAGYDIFLAPKNADAQIGPVKAGADWIASSLVAGATNPGAASGNFGVFNDAKIAEAGDAPGISSRIESLTIAGHVFGSPEAFRSGDNFGFVAEQIDAVKIGGRTFTLNAGPANDGRPITPRMDGVNGDVTLHEIGTVIGSTLSAGAPPKLVNAKTVTYTDSDGDRVTIKLSKPVLTAANVNSVVHFDIGTVGDGAPELRQLQYLDLRPLASKGLGVKVTVVQNGTGDGLAHVGGIVATGFDVGAVRISGDLGVIIAGDAKLSTPGVKSLAVRTLARFAQDTQGNLGLPGLAPTLLSDIEGPLGKLTVGQDVAGATLDVNGKIGAVKIGGSLIGGDGTNSGAILGRGIGAVKIGHHLQGGLGTNSGSIQNASGAIASFTAGGSVLGAGGMGSGAVFGGFSLGPVKIAHNLRGGSGENAGRIENATESIAIGASLLGGLGVGSGQLTTEGKIGKVTIGENIAGNGLRAGRIFSLSLSSVTVGGSLLGGPGRLSGTIGTVSSGASGPADIGTVKIAHEMSGGTGQDSGKISSGGKLGAVKIGGSFIGGNADYNTVSIPSDGVAGVGQIFAFTDLGKVKIGGNVIGGAGVGSAEIHGQGDLGSLSIAGSLIGGGGQRSAFVLADKAIGKLKIGREIFGGTQLGAGDIVADSESINFASVGGSLFGGAAERAGRLAASRLGTIQIGGDIIGGAGLQSGFILAAGGKLGSISIGGSLVGGTVAQTGGIDAGEIGTVKIGRNLIGSSIVGTAADLHSTGLIVSGDRLAAVTLGGSIFAGFDASTGGSLTRSGSIRAADDLGAITVKGSLHGTTTAAGLNPVIISARGQETPKQNSDLAIKSLKIGGTVEQALLFAGYGANVDAADTTTAFLNNDAQIGRVSIGRDWIASSLVAGILDAGNNGFGNLGDTPDGAGSIAKIARIIIKGAVAGTAAGGDHFGFSSVQIGSFKNLAYTAPLTAAKNVIELSLPTSDVTIRES